MKLRGSAGNTVGKLLVSLLLASAPALAQDVPRVRGSGGPSMTDEFETLVYQALVD